MNERFKARLISGGHKGTEAEFGRYAERWNIDETTLSFDGHKMDRAGGTVEVLDDSELARGDISMEMVFQRLHRRFARGKGIRRVIQSMFHVVSRGDELFAVGWIQPDKTVKGGTGWGIELGKFFNRPVHVFDQETERWYTWLDQEWQETTPELPDKTFAATGTRNLTDAGKQAVADLFERSFGDA